MDILPAIDVLDGSVVRLLKGDFGAVTAYASDPAAQVNMWADHGASLVHVVDLEGARSGMPTPGLLEAASKFSCRFQIGGGIRTEAAARAAIGAGASRVVLGSAAVWDPELVGRIVDELGPERVVAAVDVTGDRATGAGWLDEGRPVTNVVMDLVEAGARWILATGIATDGTMGGPDLDLILRVMSLADGVNVIGSGGVGSLDDLRAMKAAGVAEVVVGRALYEQRFSLEAAIAATS